MLILLVCVFCSCVVSTTTIQVFQTSKFSNDRISRKDDLYFSNISYFTPPSNLTVFVNSSNKKQVILGFGGALTESSAIVFNKMSSKHQEQVLDLYYNENKYAIGRLEINSCDFSTGNWSSDDVPLDYKLSHFDLSKHDTEVIIPLVQRVLEKNPDLLIFASPWSPPGWMKKSKKMDGSEQNGLIESLYDTWANYFVKWITSYRQHNINVQMVTTQNEPVMPSRWESCVFDADHLKKFTSVLVEKLNRIGVKVLIFDDQKDRLLSFVPTILSDPLSMEHVYGIAFHWYDGPFFEDVEKTHQLFPNKILMGTEHTYTKGPIFGSFSRGEGYAFDIIGDFQAGSSAWVDWNIILDATGGPNHVGNVCDAPILYDTDKEEIIIEPMFYYMGQFSRFLDAGVSRVIGSTWIVDHAKSYQTGKIFSIAFSTKKEEESEEIVVVVMNKDENDREISIIDPDNGSVLTNVPKRSITTFVYQK